GPAPHPMVAEFFRSVSKSAGPPRDDGDHQRRPSTLERTSPAICRAPKQTPRGARNLGPGGQGQDRSLAGGHDDPATTGPDHMTGRITRPKPSPSPPASAPGASLPRFTLWRSRI